VFNFRRTDATIPIWVAATVLALDQVTKVWAAAALDSQVIDVFWKLRLNLTTNTGFAFSAAQGFGPFLGVLALVVTVVLWRMRQRFSGALSNAALGMVVGGALGNVADRCFRSPRWGRGAVIDFIDLQFWPIFNVADMAIVTGVAILSVRMWVDQRGEVPLA